MITDQLIMVTRKRVQSALVGTTADPVGTPLMMAVNPLDHELSIFHNYLQSVLLLTEISTNCSDPQLQLFASCVRVVRSPFLSPTIIFLYFFLLPGDTKFEDLVMTNDHGTITKNIQHTIVRSSLRSATVRSFRRSFYY